MDISHIIGDIRKSGLRMTSARKHIIELFAQSNSPLSAAELQEHMRVNKTTVYRELETLHKHGYITQVDFGEGNKRYELSALGHHHHLICTKCKSVTDIHLTDDFEKEEKKIAQKNKFTVQKHTVEFFGICQSCNTL